LVGYRDPRELTETYEIASHQSTLEQMAALLAALASEATSPSS
jgi:hypothetical protein